MQAIRILFSLLCIVTLAACASSQSVRPTAAPSSTQSPATEVTPSGPTTAPEVTTIAPQPTTAATTQAAAASNITTAAATPAVAERVLLLQQPALQGEDVRVVQQRLLDLGYSQVGAVDGIFGPQTEAAVRAFQQTNGLTVDGVVGPQTQMQLFSPQANGAVVPIVVHHDSYYLLGGVQAGTWLKAPATAPLLTGGESYRVLMSQGDKTTATGGKPDRMAEICTDAYTVNLEPAVSADAVVALGGNWEPQPRKPGELANDDPALRATVATFLQAKGIQQPDVQITRAIKIDLEGDGSDEVVVTATRLATQNQDPSDAAAGDYSFVAVQKDIDGAPTMVELTGNYFPQAGDFVAPDEYQLLAVLDLNGDGMLEIVVNGAYYEGAHTSAFQVEGNTARTLLSTGCGV